ncbi:MAG: histidine phosphatase family protein [Acetobacteraceae bacterium]|nr:histidine phosphatase family protein [Acetobacteraceae bacterium]
MAETVLHLVRHAVHDRVGEVLCGRMAGVRLAAEGQAQAARLGERLARAAPDALWSSPRERALETAECITRACGLALQVTPALDEIDYGAWTGQPFAALTDDAHWRRWNAARGVERPPGGESMAAAQHRVWHWALAQAALNLGARLVAVSHADVIKAAIAAALGLTLDAHWRFEIAPASISAIALQDGIARVLQVNEVTA